MYTPLIGRPLRTSAADAAAVRVVSSWRDFSGLRHEWNELAARVDDQVFYRHEFIAGWLRHFAGSSSLQIMIVPAGDGHLIGVLPLVARRLSVWGVRLRALHSASNHHSGRFSLLAEQPSEVAVRLRQALIDTGQAAGNQRATHALC